MSLCLGQRQSVTRMSAPLPPKEQAGAVWGEELQAAKDTALLPGVHMPRCNATAGREGKGFSLLLLGSGPRQRGPRGPQLALASRQLKSWDKGTESSPANVCKHSAFLFPPTFHMFPMQPSMTRPPAPHATTPPGPWIPA